MNITIRQAEKEDLAHILELYAQPDMDDGVYPFKFPVTAHT